MPTTRTITRNTVANGTNTRTVARPAQGRDLKPRRDSAINVPQVEHDNAPRDPSQPHGFVGG